MLFKVNTKSKILHRAWYHFRSGLVEVRTWSAVVRYRLPPPSWQKFLRPRIVLLKLTAFVSIKYKVKYVMERPPLSCCVRFRRKRIGPPSESVLKAVVLSLSGVRPVHFGWQLMEENLPSTILHRPESAVIVQWPLHWAKTYNTQMFIMSNNCSYFLRSIETQSNSTR